MQKRTKALAWLCTKAIFLALFVMPSCGHAASDTNSPPPIPKPGPLAQPRSLQQVGLPLDQTRATIPPDNPQTPEKIALGQKLFFDGRLSADGTVACATCHDPARAFTDGRPVSIGIHGRPGQRNSPTVLNALYNKTQFWDGRVKTFEEQAELPIINPVEMGQTNMDAAVASIQAIKEYRDDFEKVFGRPPNGPDIQRAIASYERTLFSFNSPFDRFIAGDANAIDDSAKRGWKLFNTQARCNKCHALSDNQPNLINFTDNDFHNIGIGIIRHHVVPLARQAEKLVNSGNSAAIDRAAILTDFSVLGRFLVTKKQPDIASFKTQNLRNLLLTAPYFHDGSQETLWDTMDHYNKGDGVQNPFLDQDIQPLALSEDDINDLVAFLASLTSDDYKEPAAKELARQRAIAKTNRPQRDTARAFGPKPVQPPPGP
ncbi:cytochrome-c peroxidase [Pedosphaera parvula]|uniref:Cytochrome-c peroxidase n=1 Tax=Pedosphaera parvula (strain Ellin514) TaxID=320771 RepID=B9XML5_PEDPL|nr:cytochrome c peroxidase [Pedosphaera parvula]EEF58914.1 Cytochrome-c peroxidase [Pedosphaera parvula Ellin514]